MHNQISTVIKESGLEQSTASAIEQKFLPLFQQASEWKAKAEQLVVTNETQISLMKQAGEARRALKKIRTTADAVRKELKEDSIRYGRAVQGVYNVIEYLIVPIEDHLSKQERFIEIQEEERKNNLRIERTEIARPLAAWLPNGLDFGIMSDEDFEKLIAGAEAQKRRQEEQEKEEQQRLIIQQAHDSRLEVLEEKWQFVPSEYKDDTINFGLMSDDDWEQLTLSVLSAEEEYVKEQEKQAELARLHNQRAKDLRDYWQFIPIETPEDLSMLTNEEWDQLVETVGERKTAFQIEQQRIKEENERMRKEQEAAAEQRRKEQAEQQRKLDEERKKREAIEKELADKKAAEEKAEQERLAAVEAELSKGDKEKFQSYLNDLAALKTKYQFKSVRYTKLLTACNELIDKIINYANQKLNK